MDGDLNSSEFFDFVKNRLADYSSFLTEDYNKNLKVHSVTLVHPNFSLREKLLKIPMLSSKKLPFPGL